MISNLRHKQSYFIKEIYNGLIQSTDNFNLEVVAGKYRCLKWLMIAKFKYVV